MTRSGDGKDELSDDEKLSADRGSYPADPTLNVQNLLLAAVKRLDDIAEIRERFQDKLAEIRERHTQHLLDIGASHQKELSEKESGRLDSIRQVDQANQAAAAKAALDAIQALATTTTTNADNIRNALNATTAANAKQVTDLAASIAASTAASLDALAVRIAALEKAQAEGVGKGRVVDPQIEALISQVSALTESRSAATGRDNIANPALDDKFASISRTLVALDTKINSLQDTRNVAAGKGVGVGATWGWIVGGVGIVGAIMVLVLNATKLFGGGA